MSIKWLNLFVCILILFNADIVKASAPENDKIHSQVLSYCDDLTLNKKILIGHYRSGGYATSMSDDLAVYDQKLCQQTIDKLLTSESSLVLTASPLVFDFYPDTGSSLIPLRARTFDYSFICSSTRLTSITLSSADSWEVLNCIKNKAQIRAISLIDFDYQLLDLRLLKQFPNLELLSLSRGKLTDMQALTSLTSLKHLSLNSLNISANQWGYIAQLPALIGLKIAQFPRVEVLDFISLTTLESLELVFIAEHGIDLTGLEKMQTLTHLNLQGSHISDVAYHDIVQLNQLQQLNLANNIGITTVAPLKKLPNLMQLTISDTSVSDLAPLATHQELFGKGYAVGYSVHFDGSKIVDLTFYYEAGGVNSDSSKLLVCSPTSREEYLAGKQCNEEQRRQCKTVDYGFLGGYFSGPFCLWWYGD